MRLIDFARRRSSDTLEVRKILEREMILRMVIHSATPG